MEDAPSRWMDREGGYRALLAAEENLRQAGQCLLERDGERTNLIGVEADLIGGLGQAVGALALWFEPEA